MLPVLVPIMVISALFLDRGMVGVIGFTMIATAGISHSEAYDFHRGRVNRENMTALAEMIEAHDPRGTFLAFDAPPLLYAMTNTAPLSPLAFPNHLNHEIERDVSYIDTDAEMARVLDAHPGAVAISTEPRVRLYNRENWGLVLDYVQANCQLIGEAKIYEFRREDDIRVYGDCLPDSPIN